VNATELYSHTLSADRPTDQDFDAWENVNLAVSEPTKHAAVMTVLMTQLQTHFNRFALPHGGAASDTANTANTPLP
jgi:hypothetical protein